MYRYIESHTTNKKSQRINIWASHTKKNTMKLCLRTQNFDCDRLDVKFSDVLLCFCAGPLLCPPLHPLPSLWLCLLRLLWLSHLSLPISDNGAELSYLHFPREPRHDPSEQVRFGVLVVPKEIPDPREILPAIVSPSRTSY
jgi:hypothetical protein